MRKLVGLLICVVLFTGCTSDIEESINDNIIKHVEIGDKTIRKSRDRDTEAVVCTDSYVWVDNTTESNTESIEIYNDTFELKEDATIIDVPYSSQDNYPVGCELVSSSMLLNYYNIDISVDDMIDNKYIELCKFTMTNDGVLVGGNPNLVFVGDPRDAHSYGCFSGAIISMFNNISKMTDYNVNAVDIGGTSIEDICHKYIDENIPVLIWASINMEEIARDQSWIIYKEDGTSEMFTWTSGEHCLVLVGYDSDNYYFNDPLKGKAVGYSRDIVEMRYAELGFQSIMISVT